MAKLWNLQKAAEFGKMKHVGIVSRSRVFVACITEQTHDIHVYVCDARDLLSRDVNFFLKTRENQIL